MARARGDDKTLDLLDWEPKSVEVKFGDEEQVRAASLAHRISRSVSTILKESETPRSEIAGKMTEFLDSTVSEAMLNAYASESRESHNISLERAEALLHATDDPRIFGDILSRHGYAVIPKRFLAAIEDAMCDDLIERTKKRKALARRTWRGKS